MNCRDMTKLISDSTERKLTLAERLELWMHIMMCGLCRRFRANALALRRLVQEVDEAGEELTNEPSSTLSPEAKERIVQTLKNVKPK